MQVDAPPGQKVSVGRGLGVVAAPALLGLVMATGAGYAEYPETPPQERVLAADLVLAGTLESIEGPDDDGWFHGNLKVVAIVWGDLEPQDQVEILLPDPSRWQCAPTAHPTKYLARPALWLLRRQADGQFRFDTADQFQDVGDARRLRFYQKRLSEPRVDREPLLEVEQRKLRAVLSYVSEIVEPTPADSTTASELLQRFERSSSSAPAGTPGEADSHP